MGKKVEVSEEELRKKIETEVKEKYERERTEKTVKDKRETVKKDNKQDSEQVFRMDMVPDLASVLTSLQKQVAELVEAEKVRRYQEQLNYQSWYPVHYQNAQHQ